jgi:hypothetical protein
MRNSPVISIGKFLSCNPRVWGRRMAIATAGAEWALPRNNSAVAAVLVGTG